jgi:hypothetical protein
MGRSLLSPRMPTPSPALAPSLLLRIARVVGFTALRGVGKPPTEHSPLLIPFCYGCSAFLFLVIPAAIVPDDPILKNTLERLSAYCLRACIALPSMRSFHAARHIFWLGSHSRLIRHSSQQLSLTSLLGAPLFSSPFLILPGL